jgi:hypothetical protein
LHSPPNRKKIWELNYSGFERKNNGKKKRQAGSPKAPIYFFVKIREEKN